MQHVRYQFHSIHVAARILLLVLWLLGSAWGAAPFESLSLGIQPAVNTNRNVFHKFWNPRIGFDVFVITPFYWGQARVGIQSISFTGREVPCPDFRITYIYAGWGNNWVIGHRLSWAGNVLVGNSLMTFAQETEQREYETELGICLSTSLNLQATERCTIHLSGFYHHIYTHKSIDLIVLSGGASYTIPMPGWLREFLE